MCVGHRDAELTRRNTVLQPGTKSLLPLEASGYWDYQNCREKNGDCPPKLKTAVVFSTTPSSASSLTGLTQFMCMTCRTSQQNLHLIHNFSSSGMPRMLHCGSEHLETSVGHCRGFMDNTSYSLIHTALIMDYKCWCAEVTPSTLGHLLTLVSLPSGS